MSNNEIWKDVTGYEGLYQVSNLGRVKSLDRLSRCKNNSYSLIKGVVLKQAKNKKGYLFVNICKNNVKKTHFIHRLVAFQFVAGYNTGLIINHKDCNPSNNKAENLEWVDYRYNNLYENRVLKSKNTARKNKQPAGGFPVAKYTKNGEFIKAYESITEAEKDTGCNHRHISDCTKNKRKSHGGFIWKRI